jgi:hypothetical protein
MDIMTRLPRTTSGFDAIAIFINAQTHYVRIVPIKKAVSGTQFSAIFHDTIFRHYGIPKSLSNRNTNCMTDLWKEFVTLIGTKINLTTTFEPQQTEQSEFMGHVISYLRSFLTQHNGDWDKYVNRRICPQQPRVNIRTFTIFPTIQPTCTHTRHDYHTSYR